MEHNRQNTITLQEEIEQLAPSFQRSYQISTTTLANGEYNLIRKNTANDSKAEQDACQTALCYKRNPKATNWCKVQGVDAIPESGTLNVLITKFSKRTINSTALIRKASNMTGQR